MVRALSDSGLDTRDIEIITDVKDHGWHLVRVAEEKGSAGWAHSIGFYENFSHPEVVIFGLEADVLVGVVEDIGNDIRSGKRFRTGQSYDGILEGVECVFKPVHRRWFAPFLVDCEWYYAGDSFGALQCIWPDREGRTPWSESFSSEWGGLQPLLFQNHPEAARATGFLESLSAKSPAGETR